MNTLVSKVLPVVLLAQSTVAPASVSGQREEFRSAVERALRVPLTCERKDADGVRAENYAFSIEGVGPRSTESFVIGFNGSGGLELTTLVAYEGDGGARLGELAITRHGERMTYRHTFLGHLTDVVEVVADRDPRAGTSTVQFSYFKSRGASPVLELRCQPVRWLERY